MKLIAFGHQSRVGKDTAAHMLAGHVGDVQDVHITSFAFRLKRAAEIIFGHYGLEHAGHYEFEDNAHLRDQELPFVRMTPVELWIALGMKVREIYAPTWVDAVMMSDVVRRKQLASASLVIITDLRFHNEALAIQSKGGYCVKVTRPDAPPPKGSDNEIPPDFKWDAVIVNDGSFDDLRSKVIATAEQLGVC